MKGTIYGIFNDTENVCYIGSTKQLNPKKRYWRHKTDAKLSDRYDILFHNDTRFKELHTGEYEHLYQLRENENTFIQLWQNQQDWKCINRNLAYCPPELRQTCARAAQAKYKRTDKGKEHRKWQNWRKYHRNKINLAILNLNKL